MERFRQLVAAAALAGAGCSSAGGLPATPGESAAMHSARKMVGMEAPPAAPASQMFCFWQRELSQLPDPSKDGQMSSGLAGQLFLLDSAGQAAPVTGDVTVAVYDATPRPAGQAARTPEVWHITRDVVERMATADERFGRSYVLFAPWPASWKDVQAVRILTRYDPAGGTTLHAGEVKMTLDQGGHAGGVWSKGPGNPAEAGLLVPAGAKVLEGR